VGVGEERGAESISSRRREQLADVEAEVEELRDEEDVA
jgi:hypothetical protein